MTPPADDGGSIVNNYQLEIKGEDEDEWQVVLGQEATPNLSLNFHVGSDMVQIGEIIQVRYRVKNSIGWSPFSRHAYLLKAGVPEKPPKPLFVSADSTSVTIEILRSNFANGSPISEYQIWRDKGQSN